MFSCARRRTGDPSVSALLGVLVGLYVGVAGIRKFFLFMEFPVRALLVVSLLSVSD